MISPALRAWLTGLGAFLILKTDQYFIIYFMDASQLPPYNAAYQIVSNIYIFATSIALGSSVYISHLWQAGDLAQVHSIVKRIARMGMTLMACGVACVVVAGKPLIDLWLGPDHFIGYPILWTFCLMLMLEAHHVIVAACSRATEDEAFAVAAMISGLLNLVFTFFLVQWLGLWGVALGTLLAQMLTNNWYAVYRGLRRLKMSIWDHLAHVVMPTVGIFVVAVGLGWLAVWLTAPGNSNIVTLAAAVAATGSVLLVSMWFRGLNDTQRALIARRAHLKSAAS